MSDEVWHQLDPGAGALAPHTVRRNWWLGIAVVVASAGLLAAWYLGLVVPRLEWNDGLGAEIHDSGLMRVSIGVTNAGVVPVTMLDAGGSIPGVQFLRVDGRLPATIPPGASVSLDLHYQLTDCDAVPAAQPVPVQVHRWWGAQTVAVWPGFDGWLRDLVDHICNPQ